MNTARHIALPLFVAAAALSLSGCKGAADQPAAASSSAPETKLGSPKPLSKTQKSYDLPAFLSDEDVLTSQLAQRPGSKTIQTFTEPPEPPSHKSGQGTLLLPSESSAEEMVCLRLTITPQEAQLTYWINDVLSRPERILAEILAPKKSMVEIAVVARGFLPKQMTVLATSNTEISVALERPGPRTPTAPRVASGPSKK